jgi:hypothetical protein
MGIAFARYPRGVLGVRFSNGSTATAATCPSTSGISEPALTASGGAAGSPVRCIPSGVRSYFQPRAQTMGKPTTATMKSHRTGCVDTSYSSVSRATN